jgi:parallel beta-helix repeat protein
MVDHAYVQDTNGNGIHGSGSTDLNIVGNYVKNCNLGGVAVGHADGCIIFSNATGDSMIANNYIDTGISCIGSIDSDDNSSVVITGNICHNAATFAIDMVLPDVNAGKVVIANNFFYNSAPLTISNTSSTPTANTGPYRISITGNYFEATRINVLRAFDLSVTDNTIVNLSDTTDSGINTYYCKRCVIESNIVRGYAYGIYVDGTAGQLPESINILGNTLHNQFTTGIRTNIASTIGVVVQGNTIQTDAGYASATYSGIVIANGASVLNNVMDLQSGQYGVTCPNGGASTQGAIVSGNVIRGALTSSIKTFGGSQKNIIVNNFVQQAIADGGSPNNTVTGTVTIQ